MIEIRAPKAQRPSFFHAEESALPQFLATLGAFRFAENGENYKALSCRVEVSVGLLSFHALNVTWVGILCKCATTYFAGTAADAPNSVGERLPYSHFVVREEFSSRWLR